LETWAESGELKIVTRGYHQYAQVRLRRAGRAGGTFSILRRLVECLVEEILGRPSRNSDQEERFMKHRILSVLVMIVLVLALTFPVAVPAAPPAGNTQPPTGATAAPAAEPHPEIHEAIASLRRAREHLQHAKHDFGGHRVEALGAIDAAIHQLEVCLEYDK
jgi:hypothetical protein